MSRFNIFRKCFVACALLLWQAGSVSLASEAPGTQWLAWAQSTSTATDRPTTPPPTATALQLSDSQGNPAASATQADSNNVVQPARNGTGRNSRAVVLIGSFTVFLLAVFVGFEIITKVPPTLHTPLMSGSNAISGITIVGAILTAGHAAGGFGSFLGMLAVILASVNVVGGFLVTRRMLMMFKKR